MGERVLKLFDSNNDGMITEESFIAKLRDIFVSDLDTRMKITFDM